MPKGTEGVILLTDLSGRVLQQWPVNEQDRAIRLSGDDLPKGIYLLNLVVEGRVAGTDKMVIQ